MAPGTRTVRSGFFKPLLLAAALTVVLVLPAAAHAAGWAAFSAVPTGGGAVSGLKLASDPTGNQVAVWVEQPSPFRVMASYRPVGGDWGAAQTLDSLATTQPLTDLAVDDKGNFIVVFTQFTAASKKVMSAYLENGQTGFGTAQTFSTQASTAPVTGIAVALDRSSGTAYAVHGMGGAIAAVGGARTPGTASPWAPASAGLGTDLGAAIDMVVGTDGVPTLAYYTGANSQPQHSRYNGAAWVTITTPAGATSATGTLRVAADPAGRTTTVFQDFNTNPGVYAQSCPPGVTAPTQCGPRQTIFANAAVAATAPTITAAPDGNAAVAWVQNGSVQASRRSGATDAWSAPAAMGTGAAPAASFDSTGGLMVTYAESSNRIMYLFAPAGTALAPPSLSLTDPAQSWNLPGLAADGAGNTFGAWSTASAIQSAVYDVESPSALTISAPVGAPAGSLVTFNASASDRWSGVSYAWDFGDGTTATGASAQHVYGTPGTYNARVTATDGAGNQSSQTQTVTISQSPTPPPPPPPTPPPAGLPMPQLGKTVNLYVIKPPVRVKLPGRRRFRALAKQEQVPNGTVVDTRKGRVLVVIADGKGGTDAAEFYAGVFEVNQPKRLKGLANIFLDGGGFKGCPKAPKNPHAQVAAGKKQSKHRSVRRLWGKGSGKFRTVGRFGSASVRGTWWLTDDRCDGTLFKVRQGKVAVRDFVKKITKIVTKGKRYFAAAKRR